MVKYLGPIEGLIIGICLIVFSKKVGLFLQKSFDKFPKYKDGVETFNIKFEVRPVFIVIIGFIFVAIGLAGFYSIWPTG